MSSINKPVVYITRNIPPEGMRLLQNEDLELRQWQSDDPVPRDQLKEHIKDADALFCLLTDKIDEELLREAKKPLRVVSTMSATITLTSMHVNVETFQSALLLAF